MHVVHVHDWIAPTWCVNRSRWTQAITLNLGWTLHWCWVWHHHSLECWCRCNTGYFICMHSLMREVYIDDKVEIFARMLALFLSPIWTLTWVFSQESLIRYASVLNQFHKAKLNFTHPFTAPIHINFTQRKCIDVLSSQTRVTRIVS